MTKFKSFSVNDLAHDYLNSLLIDRQRTKTPAEQLAEIYEYFHANNAIRNHATDYADNLNDALPDDHDEDDALDADDFRLALEEEINERCEGLLYQHAVGDELDDAKSGVQEQFAWREYAADVQAAIQAFADRTAEYAE